MMAFPVLGAVLYCMKESWARNRKDKIDKVKGGGLNHYDESVNSDSANTNRFRNGVNTAGYG